MCREVCELLKTFLFPPIVKQEHVGTTSTTISSLTSTSSSSLTNDPNNHMDDNNTNGFMMGENDLNEMKSIEKEDTAVNSHILSDMAMALLKSNKNIYQSTLLLLFEGNFYMSFL